MQNISIRVSQKLETVGLNTVSAVNVSCNVTKPVHFMLQHVCCLCVYCWKLSTILISQ
jgi:hypothetical protein